MQLDGGLVVVPLWLLNAAKQIGLPMSSLVNLNELANHFSHDDLTSYNGLNKLFNSNSQTDAVPSDNIFGCYHDLFRKIDLLKESANESSSGIQQNGVGNKLLSGIEEGGLVFLKEADGMSTLYQSLITPSYAQPASINPNVYVINLFHIENDTFGLTMKPYDGTDTNTELESLHDNMKTLLTHYKYEAVCQTPLFHRWCFKIKLNQQ